MPANPSDLRAPRRALAIAALRHRLRLDFVGLGAQAAAAEFSAAWNHLLDEDSGHAARELTVAVPENDREALDAAQAQATSLITLALIELNLGRGLLFHAAAGADAHGRAFLLVGPSGAGKTTAIAHLARAASYLTDETAFVDAQTDVLPYPKPLSVVRELGGKTETSPAELGLVLPTRDRFRVGRVLIVDRRPTPHAPTSTRLSTAEGIMAVVAQLSGLSSHPTPLVALADLARQVGGFERLSYSDVRDIDPSAGPPTTPTLGEAALAFLLPARRRHEETGPGLVQALVDDAIEVSGVILVAHGGHVKVLSGIARTLWLHTIRPTPDVELLRVLRDIHGRVSDDEVHFRRVVDGLIEGGILEWRP